MYGTPSKGTKPDLENYPHARSALVTRLPSGLLIGGFATGGGSMNVACRGYESELAKHKSEVLVH